jgi:hypothetical protein
MFCGRQCNYFLISATPSVDKYRITLAAIFFLTSIKGRDTAKLTAFLGQNYYGDMHCAVNKK